MTNFNENWSRLESVIVWAGMSVNGFAHYIGLSRAENLYQIKSGKNGISRNLVNRIVESFPQISAAWLLMGEGSMLLSEDKGGQGVPFYDGDSVWQNLSELQSIEPSTYLSIPPLGACDCAVRCYDEAMSKEILPGTIVFLKQIDPKVIIPGSVCVLVCANFVLLRRVRFSKSALGQESQCEILKLEPTNKSYDSIEISLDEIVKAYSVVGSLKLF